MVSAGVWRPSSTAWVWVTRAIRRPSGASTRVCHTMVRRPRWSGVHSPSMVVPLRPAARKLVFDSMVVVEEPRGRFSTVATAPKVSAKAITAPPWSTPGRVQRRSCTSRLPRTRSFSASRKRMPRVPGKKLRVLSVRVARSSMAGLLGAGVESPE